MAGAIRTIRLTLSAAEIRRGVRSVNKSLLSIDKTTKKVQGSVGLLTKMYGSLFAIGLVRGAAEFAIELAKTSEEMDLMSKKLAQLTGDASALMTVMATADEIGVEFDTLGKIVGRFAVATDKAFSVDTMTDWAEGLVLAARSIGASQQEINSAILQFSQALGSGVLQGEEFRAVNESMVPLMTEIADVLGISRVELKKYSKEGKINTAVMVKALGQLNDEMKEFSGLTDTMDAALARLTNSWSRFTSEFIGSENIIKDAVNSLAELINTVTNLKRYFGLVNEGKIVFDRWPGLDAALAEVRKWEEANTGANLYIKKLKELNLQHKDFEAQILRLEKLLPKAMNPEAAAMINEMLSERRKQLAGVNAELETQGLLLAKASGFTPTETGGGPSADALTAAAKAAEKIKDEISSLQKEMRTADEVLFDYIENIERLEKHGLDSATAFRAIDQAFQDYNETLDEATKESGPLALYVEQLVEMQAALDLLPDKVAALDEAMLDGIISTSLHAQELQKLTGTIKEEVIPATEEFSEAMKIAIAGEVVGGIGQMTDAFVDFAITGEQSFAEMTASILSDISKMILKMVVLNALKSTSLGSALFPSAKGNVFDGGNVIPFARGGVVDTPTVFPMAQGIGLMGEAGPEAVMPLKRDSQGNLGVAGGNTTNVVINLQGVRDAASFAKNETQITNSLQRQLAIANRNL